MNPFQTDKIYNHLDRVVEWLEGKNPFAVTMELDPTNICNHKCPGCCGFAVPNDASLDGYTMRRIVCQAAVLGVRGIIFTGGGEPLCNQDTLGTVHFIRHALQIPVGFITNGSLIDGNVAKVLVGSCQWIRVSMDAGSPEQHRRTHGVDDFFRVVEGLRLLVDEKDRTNSDVTIGTGYLTGKGTYDLEDMKQFVRESVWAGADYAQFRPFLGTDTYAKADLHEFSPVDFSELETMGNERTRIVNSTHKYKVINSRPRNEDGEIIRTYDKCYGHQFATAIQATGDLTICCHTRGLMECSLGNIHKDPLAVIWNSRRRKEVTENIDLSKCPLLCRADNFNEILWQVKQPKHHKEFL